MKSYDYVPNPDLDAWLDRQAKIKNEADDTWMGEWRRLRRNHRGTCDGVSRRDGLACGVELKDTTKGLILKNQDGTARLLCGKCRTTHHAAFGYQSGWAAPDKNK